MTSASREPRLPVVVVFLLGLWVTAGLITDDFKVSIGLTAAWVAICATR